jgi:NADP-dependent 3-hydroxy acid dehydrogenase YdfG
VTIGSVARLIVAPGTVVYCASRHAVRAINEGLRKELTGRIRVTEINPGAVTSELLEASNSDAVAERAAGAFNTWVPAETITDAVRYAITQPAASRSTRSPSAPTTRSCDCHGHHHAHRRARRRRRGARQPCAASIRA